MGVISDLKRWLYPRKKLTHNHGGRVISPYQLIGADETEKTLILAGIARSPEDARFLLKKHKVKSAKQLLKLVDRHKKHPTVRERFAQLIRRIDGHDPRDVYGSPKYDPPKIRVTYRYRGKR